MATEGAPQDPTPELRALHCGLSGRSIVKVRPNSGKVSIGEKTWTLDASCVAHGSGKEKWDIMLIDGKGRAVSFNPDLENPSPEEWDQAINNNLLKQIHDLSKPPPSPALNWVQIVLLGLAILAVIGAGIKNANDNADLKKEILHLELVLNAGTAAGGDTSNANTHPSSSGGTVQH